MPIALALVASAALAVYPATEPGAASASLFVDLGLLWLAAHGRRWARALLLFTSAVAASVLVLAGVGQLDSDPRYFARGVFLAAAVLLILWPRPNTAQAASTA